MAIACDIYFIVVAGELQQKPLLCLSAIPNEFPLPGQVSTYFRGELVIQPGVNRSDYANACNPSFLSKLPEGSHKRVFERIDPPLRHLPSIITIVDTPAANQKNDILISGT